MEEKKVLIQHPKKLLIIDFGVDCWFEEFAIRQPANIITDKVELTIIGGEEHFIVYQSYMEMENDPKTTFFKYYFWMDNLKFDKLPCEIDPKLKKVAHVVPNFERVRNSSVSIPIAGQLYLRKYEEGEKP